MVLLPKSDANARIDQEQQYEAAVLCEMPRSRLMIRREPDHRNKCADFEVMDLGVNGVRLLRPRVQRGGISAQEHAPLARLRMSYGPYV